MRGSLEWKRAGIVFGLVALPFLYLFLSGTSLRWWSEKVDLGDGHVVLVKRYVRFTSSNSLSGDAHSSTDLRSTLKIADAGMNIPTWDVPLIPIVLYRDPSNGEWAIVATTENCDTWWERGHPTPPYWEYRLRQGAWERTALSQTSAGRRANLFFDYETGTSFFTMTPVMKAGVMRSENFDKRFVGVQVAAESNCGYSD